MQINEGKGKLVHFSTKDNVLLTPHYHYFFILLAQLRDLTFSDPSPHHYPLFPLRTEKIEFLF